MPRPGRTTAVLTIKRTNGITIEIEKIKKENGKWNLLD